MRVRKHKQTKTRKEKTTENDELCMFYIRALRNIYTYAVNQETRNDKICLIIPKFYLPTDAQKSCFKRILKFTLKQLLHVSVQSPSGSVLFELAKVIVIKIIS